MVLKIYNTQARGKEVFTPLVEGKVGMYVCGVTPYDLSHIGHARSYVAFDVIRRYLEYLGYDVTYLQNFTDVDDKIIAHASEEGLSPSELSKRNIEEYHRDMDALGVKRADSYPLVSENIDGIIGVVKTLVEKGLAYEASGDVYLDVSKKEDYGKLSGQPIDDLKAGARVDVDEKKRSPLDFTLWKHAKEGEISWQSPWGRGRPGWHIECSVMSTGLLGPTLDIHGGGQDLIFPHHENEIAQSESYTGKEFARFWLHNGLVTVDGQKMSKSLGNYTTIREILKSHSPLSLRFFLLSAHYRRPMDFTVRALGDSAKGLSKIQNTIFNLKAAINHASESSGSKFESEALAVKKDFHQALEDDFNTPQALATLFRFTREINAYLSETTGKSGIETALSTIIELTGVLGLRFETELSEKLKAYVEGKIRLRSELRRNKDYTGADEIRLSLLEEGILLEDKGERTLWRLTDPDKQV